MKEFHALPKVLKDKLSHYGISNEEDTRVWSALRQATETIEGNKYLIPNKILTIKDVHFEAIGVGGDLIQPANEKLLQAARGYLLDRVNTGIATPGQIEWYLIPWDEARNAGGGVFSLPDAVQDVSFNLHHETVEIGHGRPIADRRTDRKLERHHQKPPKPHNHRSHVPAIANLLQTNFR